MILCFLCNTHVASAKISICCRFWHCTQHTHELLISLHTVHFAKYHDDAIKLKHFPCYSPFVRGISGHRWIPLTKANDAELWCYQLSAPEQTVEQTIETPVIETEARSWRHCNDTRNKWNRIERNFENCVWQYWLTCNEIIGYVIAVNAIYKHIPFIVNSENIMICAKWKGGSGD